MITFIFIKIKTIVNIMIIKKNNIYNIATKNITTIYFMLLFLVSILYLLFIIFTPEMSEINTIFYEISELNPSQEKINTLSFGINYYERSLHILFTILISVPSFCILWIDGHLIRKKNDTQGNMWKQFGFGLICIGLFLILEIVFKILVGVRKLNLFFEINSIIRLETDATSILYFCNFHILYPIIVILPILLYIYGIHLFKKIGSEELFSIKRIKKIEKIIIGGILSIFIITFSWFYFFFFDKLFLSFHYSYLSNHPSDLLKIMQINVITSKIYGISTFSKYFNNIILPVVILKAISIYIQEDRLKDITRIKKISKIIEIFIFMIFFSVFYNIIRFLPPIFGVPYDVINPLDFIIELFPYAIIPFYIRAIWKVLKVWKKRKKIRDNLNKRIDVDDVLNRHQKIIQKINENQNKNEFDLETQPHGKIK